MTKIEEESLQLQQVFRIVNVCFAYKGRSQR